MIEVFTVNDIETIETWLERVIKPHLRPTVSTYATGRYEAWLNVEPTLTNPPKMLQGVQIHPNAAKGLKDLIAWDWDYALVTYAPSENMGIRPHRDATYANYEAYNLNVTGKARFDYWLDYPEFWWTRDQTGYEVNRQNAEVTLRGEPTPPDTVVNLEPGTLVQFNCKNPHASYPSAGRWNINFWKKK